MEKALDKKELKRKSFVSVITLFLQSGVIQAMGFITNLILTVILSPAVFGLYFTVLSIMAILNYFSDIGLAASLIQKDKAEDDDFATAFTAQQILIIAVCVAGFLATPYVTAFYSLPPSGIYLYWSLLLAFFLSSLKTIPTIILERQVNFVPISYVQIFENAVFYLTVAVLAIRGLGINAFTYATLARSVTGLVGIYIVSPWVPRLRMEFGRLKGLLSYGIPFQTNSILALVKDELLTLYLGKIIGFTNLGYVGWAKKWSAAPQQLVMTNFLRVAFPMFSRLKNDPVALKNSVEKFLYFMALILFPILMGIFFAMPLIIEVIPRYGKWVPGLNSFYLFILSAVFSSLTTPLTNLFNAIGRVKLSLALMTVWTMATWVFIPVAVFLMGFNGVAFSVLIISAASLLVVFLAKKYVDFSFLKSIRVPILSTAAMSVILYLLPVLSESAVVQLAFVVLTGVSAYSLSVITLSRGGIFAEMQDLLKLWRKTS